MSSDLGTAVSSPTLGLRSGREAWYSGQMEGVEVSTYLEKDLRCCLRVFTFSEQRDENSL